MTNRLTELEIKAATKPQILTLTKRALDKGKSSASIATILNRRFRLHLTKSTVEKFRRKRWLPQRLQLQQQKNAYAAGADIIKERGLGAAAQALLFQKVKELDPTHLLGIMRIEILKQKLRLQKKALKAAKTEPPLTTEQQQALSQKAVTTMRDIFGISDRDHMSPQELAADTRRLEAELSINRQLQAKQSTNP